jgi:hypothetical protein
MASTATVIRVDYCRYSLTFKRFVDNCCSRFPYTLLSDFAENTFSLFNFVTSLWYIFISEIRVK